MNETGKATKSGRDARAPRLGWHTRGYLPHFEGGSIAQETTFRLTDSFPSEPLDRWRNELACLPHTEAEAERRRRIEDYLDLGIGEALLRHSNVAGMVENALLYFDGARYRLHAWVVMPNHVHTLFTPENGFGLSSILFSWKSFTAKEANRILGRHGQFWQEDYFDRYVRNEEHYWTAVDYIEMNPVKASLCERKEDWPFSSASRR
ncbi:MAG: REP-associated tyrosine transposase [Terriglobia bacterium]